MGRAGDCKVCYSRKAAQVDASHARGESARSIARRLALSEPTVRRHLRSCKPRSAQKRKGGLVTRQHLEGVAAEFGLTLVELLRHHVLCMGGDVVTSSDGEAHELCELLGDAAPCCAEEAPCL